MKSNQQSIRSIALSAMLLAFGLVLPLFTGQIPQIGNALLPMHIPVLICSIVCGYKLGLTVGFILPILRSIIFGMPMMFPMAIAMAFELAVYGFLFGYLYYKLPKKTSSVFIALIVSMISGRIVWGIVSSLLLVISGGMFTFQLFIAGALLNAIPGIILQIVLLPLLVMYFEKKNIVKK